MGQITTVRPTDTRAFFLCSLRPTDTVRPTDSLELPSGNPRRYAFSRAAPMLDDEGGGIEDNRMTFPKHVRTRNSKRVVPSSVPYSEARAATKSAPAPKRPI